MKLNEHSNKLESNVQNQTQEFGIGDASVVIEILRNRLYENKIQTLVQEYICNARDAMREVSKGNKFEVTVPSEFDPTFKVRDFGPGISPERMAGVFILYGASTKRGSNNQTGGFGIGAKSAWSYTDSFTIVTVVDGIKRSYVAHTGVNNNGRLDLVETIPTNEENGTEIQVAVQIRDIREFRQAIVRAIYFWTDRPVIKGNLDIPSFEISSGLSVDGILVSIEGGKIDGRVVDTYDKSPYAIIDGIPYMVTEKLISKCNVLGKLCSFLKKKPLFFFGNGVVEVSASRESIADSEYTKKALEQLATKCFMNLKTHIAGEFGAVKNSGDHIKTYTRLATQFHIEKGFATYKGYTIQHDVLKNDIFKKVLITKVTNRGRGGRSVEKLTREAQYEPDREIPITNFEHLYFLNAEESPLVQNKRIRDYFNRPPAMILGYGLKVIDTMYIVSVLPKDATSPVTNKNGFAARALQTTVVTAAESKAALKQVIKELNLTSFQMLPIPLVVREEKAKISREESEFCVHSLEGDRHKYLTLKSNTQEYLYVEIGKNGWEYNSGDLYSLNEYLHRAGKDIKICGLAGRAIKMVQGNKNFSPFKQWIESWKPSKEEINIVKKSKAMLEGTASALHNAKDSKDIKDKFIVEMLKEYKEFNKEDRNSLPVLLKHKVISSKEIATFLKKDVVFAARMDSKYPLVCEAVNNHYTRDSIMQELIFYMNAKYKGAK